MLAGHPVGHEAAVRVPGDVDTLRIDLVGSLNRLYESAQIRGIVHISLVFVAASIRRIPEGTSP